MNLFVAELKKSFRPLRVFAVLCIWFAVFGMYANVAFSDVDFAVSKRACELVTSYYGTHLDASERERLDTELLGALKDDFNAKIAEHPAFIAADVKTYEEYRFLLHGKTYLSNMSEEQFNAMSDEDLMREFGVTKDVDRTLSDAELDLLAFECPEAERAREIEFLGRVYSRIEDWVDFWYDDRERLADISATDAFDYEVQQMQRYFFTDAYTGNMPAEVSESVGKCFRAVAVSVACSVLVLFCTTPAQDRIVQVDMLQAVTKKGKKILCTQRQTAVFGAFATALFGIIASAILLHAVIPSLLWNNPMNSYQSFFTVYYFSGTLRQYFWLCAVLLILFAVGITMAGFAVSAIAKSYTGLLGLLIPVWVIGEVIANTVFKIPFSCRQSLQGTYLNDIMPFAYSEIAICALLAVTGIVFCSLCVRRRERELRNL